MAPSLEIPGKCPRARKAAMPAGGQGERAGSGDSEGDRQLDLPGGKATAGCSGNQCENERSET